MTRTRIATITSIRPIDFHATPDSTAAPTLAPRTIVPDTTNHPPVTPLVEAWKVYRHPLGARLGDVWAETQVVDGKVVSNAPALTIAPEGERAPGRVMYQ